LFEKDPRKEQIKLKDLYNYMSYDKLNVHCKIVGKGKKYLKNINNFLVKKNNVKRKKFRFLNKI
jgi:hypothetical protein